VLGFLRFWNKGSRGKKKAAASPGGAARAAKQDKAPAGSGLIARLSGSMSGMGEKLSGAGRIAARIGLGMVFVALGAGWVLGREPLERRVAALAAQPSEIRFNWPVAGDPKSRRGAVDPRETWLPAAVRNDLIEIARQHIASDPFDRASLEAMRRDLAATGWFARLKSVERDAAGHINIVGDWRIPTAVVRQGRRDYLVARGGEVLKLPAKTPVAPGTMPVITNPHLAAPEDQGMLAYGKTWAGGDVTAALDLLRMLSGIPEAKRLRGVDLGQYMDKGHLVLVTDAGSRIVWGSAIGELTPGEQPFEIRRGRLRDILAQRLDTETPNIAIYTPVVMVDRTVGE
jgi:hypothetical protein